MIKITFSSNINRNDMYQWTQGRYLYLTATLRLTWFTNRLHTLRSDKNNDDPPVEHWVTVAVEEHLVPFRFHLVCLVNDWGCLQFRVISLVTRRNAQRVVAWRVDDLRLTLSRSSSIETINCSIFASASSPLSEPVPSWLLPLPPPSSGMGGMTSQIISAYMLKTSNDELNKTEEVLFDFSYLRTNEGEREKAKRSMRRSQEDQCWLTWSKMRCLPFENRRRRRSALGLENRRRVSLSRTDKSNDHVGSRLTMRRSLVLQSLNGTPVESNTLNSLLVVTVDLRKVGDVEKRSDGLTLQSFHTLSIGVIDWQWTSIAVDKQRPRWASSVTSVNESSPFVCLFVDVRSVFNVRKTDIKNINEVNGSCVMVMVWATSEKCD